MAIVVFDPTAFKQAYPEFTGINNTVLTTNFANAALMCNNTDASVVQDIPTRTTLLWLLTAHITLIFNGTNDGAGNVTPPKDLVGRVEIAKEGSVHVRADMGPASASAAWFNQTRYGAMYWAATVRYRTLRYIPQQNLYPGNQLGPQPGIWPWPWAWGRY